MTSGVSPGILTADRAGSPNKTSRICSATSTATLTCASAVEAPKWGVKMMFSCSLSLDSLRGSSSNTSKAAPAIFPSAIASARADSSIVPPRAQLIMRALGFILLRDSLLMMWVVSLVLGMCRVI